MQTMAIDTKNTIETAIGNFKNYVQNRINNGGKKILAKSSALFDYKIKEPGIIKRAMEILTKYITGIDEAQRRQKLRQMYSVTVRPEMSEQIKTSINQLTDQFGKSLAYAKILKEKAINIDNTAQIKKIEDMSEKIFLIAKAVYLDKNKGSIDDYFPEGTVNAIMRKVYEKADEYYSKIQRNKSFKQTLDVEMLEAQIDIFEEKFKESAGKLELFLKFDDNLNPALVKEFKKEIEKELKQKELTKKIMPSF